MYPMTVEGEALLRKELQKLKFEDRHAVIDAIATAREFGDLKENTDAANTLGIHTWNLIPGQEDVTELITKKHI